MRLEQLKTSDANVVAEMKNEFAVISSRDDMTLQELLDHFHIRMDPFLKMMNQYQCAAVEIETKFRVLNMSLSIYDEQNPIESIKTRVKRPDSIIAKLVRQGNPIDLDSVRNNIFDVAGVRVICSFIDDIYRLEKLLLSQEDVKLVKRKDYIATPKESGYRSLHLVIRTPIYTEAGRQDMNVEVQMRTIAMDFWASLEHKLRYKKELEADILTRLGKELEECASESAKLDQRMLAIRQEIDMYHSEAEHE